MDNHKQEDSPGIASDHKAVGIQNRKNIIWNALGQSSNAFYAMALMIFVTRVNGLEVMGDFSLSFYIASVFFAIGVYGGRIFQISDVKQEFTNGDYISLKFVSIFFMFGAAFLFCILTGYSWSRILLIFIFLLYRGIEAIGDAYLGVMERNYRLDLAGRSMILKTLIGLAAFITINLLTLNVHLSSMAFVLSYGLTLLFYDMSVAAKFDKITLKFGSRIFQLFKKCFPIFAIALFTLLILNITRIFVDRFLGSEMQAIFTIFVLSASIMAMFTQFVFQPFIMELTDALHNKEFHRFSKRVGRLFLLLLAIALAATSLAFLVGIPILSFVFNVDLTDFRWDLAMMVFVGVAAGAGTMLSLLLTVMRQFKLQMILFSATFIFGVILSAFLTRTQGIYGAFIGFALTYAMQLMLFSIGYYFAYRNYKKRNASGEDKCTVKE